MPAQSIALGITQLQHVLSISLAFSPASRLPVGPIQSIHPCRLYSTTYKPSVDNLQQYVVKISSQHQSQLAILVSHFQPRSQVRFGTRNAKKLTYFVNFTLEIFILRSTEFKNTISIYL